MGKTTDNLISLAKSISPNQSGRELDMLLATGEQVSAALLSMALNRMKIKSISLNAFQAQILTEGNFNEARIRDINKKKLYSIFNKYTVIVVTGFQGVNSDGEITTLGRGGSDTSAIALAASLNVKCEIYSDVAGIYTADPKLYPQARKLNYISHDEILELSVSGTKVLHSRSIEIAKKYNIEIYCASTFSEEKGTYVVNEDKIIEKSVVTGLTIQENQTQVILMNLPVNYSLVRKLFSQVAVAGFNVDMISIIADSNHITVSFTIVDENKVHLDKTVKKVLKDLLNYKLDFHSGYVKVSIAGIGMKSSVGVASDFFKALKEIPFRLVTTSEIKISVLIEKKYLKKTINSLTKKFNL